MTNTDDFLVIVPADGQAFLAQGADDLSPYLEHSFIRLNQTVALKDGRTLKGSVLRGRETTPADEIHISDLINQQFSNRRETY